MIGLPPLFAGAVKAMVACASPAVAEILVGGSGTVAGVAFAVLEGEPVPISFMALTRKL